MKVIPHKSKALSPFPTSFNNFFTFTRIRQLSDHKLATQNLPNKNKINFFDNNETTSFKVSRVSALPYLETSLFPYGVCFSIFFFWQSLYTVRIHVHAEYMRKIKHNKKSLHSRRANFFSHFIKCLYFGSFYFYSNKKPVSWNRRWCWQLLNIAQKIHCTFRE